MAKIKQGSQRDRMRDHCVAFNKLLSEHNRISISEIADALGISTRTVRRWLDSFSKIMDLRIENGIVIIERN
jgi:DeoR/GlpR family transcriptional regulator of sugar metabolism